MIWKHEFTIENLNNTRKESLVGHLGIKFSEFGKDYIKATMPVDKRTMQPFGILHGGASVSLAETVGSVASMLCIDPNEDKYPVGIEINANHLKAVSRGYVEAKATPVRLGKKIHVWHIDIFNDNTDLICTSRLTTMIISK